MRRYLVALVAGVAIVAGWAAPAAAAGCPAGRICILKDGEVLTAPLQWHSGMLVPGDELSWEVTLHNNSSEAADVAVVARPRLTLGGGVVPAHDVQVRADGKAMQADGREGYAALAKLEAGEQRQLRFSVLFPAQADNSTQRRTAEAELFLVLAREGEPPGPGVPSQPPGPGRPLPGTGAEFPVAAVIAGAVLVGAGLVARWAVGRRSRDRED